MDTPVLTRPPREFGGCPSTGLHPSSLAHSRTAFILERKQRVNALSEEERQLNISITKEEWEGAQREDLMHKRKVHEVQLRV